MKGFKDPVMRGNLVELAVAFIMAAAFAAVVTIHQLAAVADPGGGHQLRGH
jgi:large-conductance mechanosensitive channel